MRIEIGKQKSLVQACGKHRDGGRFAFPSHVPPRKFHRTSRTDECVLATRNFRALQSDGGKAGHSDASGGNVPPGPRDFKAEAVGDAVALGFVNFDECLFLIWRSDLSAGSDTRPIEDSQVVKLALCLQQLPLAERLF